MKQLEQSLVALLTRFLITDQIPELAAFLKPSKKCQLPAMLTGIIVINIFSTELGKWYQVQNFARLTIQNCLFLFLL